MHKLVTHTWRMNAGVTGLYAELGKKEDLAGVFVAGGRITDTAGYFYLHRQVPLEAYPQASSLPLDTVPARANYLFLREEREPILARLGAQGVRCERVPESELTDPPEPLYRCAR